MMFTGKKIVVSGGTGKATRLIDMVKTIIEVLGRGEFEYVPWPQSYAEVETGDYVTDIRKVENLIGWRPKTDLREGVMKTVRFYEEVSRLSGI